MPYFDPDESRKFLGEAGSDCEELDLRGLSREIALDRLDHAVAPVRNGQCVRLRVRIDPPTPGGGETLFQPVARHLLAIRRNRGILHFLPLQPNDGAGFIVERLMLT